MTSSDTPGKMPAAAMPGVQRFPEMQGWLDRMLYHPLSARLARALAPTPVSPNMVSVAGAIAICLAALAYIQPGWPWPVAAGLALHMSWHVLDGADGDLARLTGRSSPMGEIVDGICDYAGHIVLYVLLAYSVSASLGADAWMLAAGAGASRVVQANFHETQRRAYLALVHDRPWLADSVGQGAPVRFGALGKGYLALAAWVTPPDAEVEALLADPARRELARDRLAALGPQALAGSGLLGANGRTVALGLSMLAGSPVWFFLFELTVLNAVLLAGRRRYRRTMAVLAST